jgi:hypothetical protein
MLNIQIPCPACIKQSDSQPNHCRKCGGLGYLRSTISKYQLSRMGEIPQVLGATVTVKSRGAYANHTAVVFLEDESGSGCVALDACVPVKEKP